MIGTCNICGKENVWTQPLTKEYESDTIKDVCDDCLRIANKHLEKLRQMTYQLNITWMKKFIENMRSKRK